MAPGPGAGPGRARSKLGREELVSLRGGAPGGRRRGRLIQEFLLFRSRHITLVLSTGGSHHAGRGFPSSAPRMGLGRVALSLRLLIGGVGTGLAMSPGSHS